MVPGTIRGVRGRCRVGSVARVQLVTIDDVRAAVPHVADVVRPTPAQLSDTLTRLAGREVWLKPEHLQRTGSFKVRGASHHIRSLPDDGRPVIAASAGNHAQGVALAATQAGRRATVVMPETAPLPKVEATRAYGAVVRLVGLTVDDALAEALSAAADGSAHLVPPFDDPLVIAGQGTVGLELATEAPAVETVLVPVGGGGLLSGVAAALRALRPEVRIVGVEAAGAAAMRASLDAGRATTLDSVHTIADGIALKSPSALTLAHVEALVDDVITVSDEEIGRTLVLVLERCKAVVEPAGVVGLAALLSGRVPGTGPALAVLSGGNVDPLLLGKLIERGLSASGRFVRLRIVVPDRPGALARITGLLAAQGLNVLSVDHHRAGVRVGVDEVEVVFTLETRDPDQRREAVDRLRAEGLHVDLLG
ncbi:threonine ammonia-lyase [Iamia sp. SCSIO 61187]|uniref:threonine ammonia-lyase n=1 Tax=Iamia sp. SCSIO 61187 TaxID=2722752 RepID=UPI00351CE5FF